MQYKNQKRSLFFSPLGIRVLFLLFSISSFAQTPQTITFPDIPVKGYGDTSFTLNATASSGLGITYVSSNTAVATVSGNTVTIKSTSGFSFISAFQAGNSTYAAATPIPQLLVVVPKATLTVTADNKTMNAGTTTPAFTYTTAGYKKSETSSVVTGAPAFQSPGTNLTSGSYPIVINQGTLTATNYEFQMVDGVLTVNPNTATSIVLATDTLVKIYPNPANDILYVDGKNTFDISILDIQGKEYVRMTNLKNNICIPVTQLKAGCYLVKVNNGLSFGVYKIMINR
ncbi:MAG: MBG domain-containing protein [Bacteroidota bacterium]